MVNLSSYSSLIQQILFELRNVDIQNDRHRFRQNLRKFGQIAAYEISKNFTYKEETTDTILGEAQVKTIQDSIVVCPILRAGLPLHEGMLDMLPEAESGFISAYRKHQPDGSFEIYMGYTTCPNCEGKILIIVDPMLATGSSIQLAIDELKLYGTAKEIYLVSIIASRLGVEYVQRVHPDVKLFVGAIDEELTAKSYIVPGLGDAGDLAFGSKLQD